jgi:hypothetical protein
MPQRDNFNGAQFGSWPVVDEVIHAVQEYAPDTRKRDVASDRSYARRSGDQVECCPEFLFESVWCFRAVGAPPTLRGRDLT